MKKYKTLDLVIAAFAGVCSIGMIVWAVLSVRNAIAANEVNVVAPIDIMPSEIIVESAAPVEKEPVVEEIKEDTEVVTKYYDVPLNEDLQDHIFKVCETYSIDPALIIAMIECESSFREDAMGDNGRSYGLMQIQPRWHEARMERLGVTDLLDPYQNVLVGIDYLGELFCCENGIEWALMAYNGGYSYAYKQVEAGKVSNYANGVLTRAYELNLERDAVG